MLQVTKYLKPRYLPEQLRLLFLIAISILGTPDDYAVEIASGAWFGSILFPGAVGLIVGGPIGLAARCDLWRNNGL